MIVRNRSLIPLWLALFLGGLASAQSAAPGRLYDPSTETTLKGVVNVVSTVTGRHGWNGIHLTLRDQACDVHVGPAAWVAAQGFSFSPGDPVEVIASKVKWNGTDTCIARQITRGGKVLQLRDQRGFPLWSRGRWTTQ